MTVDNIIELTPFRADLSRSLARRGERILAARDLASEVAALEPLEAYYIVREIGLDQALPVILALNPEQLTTCVDLDCWQRSDFAVDGLDEWLAAFALAGSEELAKGFFALDQVVQLLFMSQTVTVYDPDTDQVPPDDQERDTPRVVTPDGFFLLDIKSELPLKIHPYALLDALYGYDAGAAFQLLSTVRVDLPMQIEEEALRFRNGRMQDLGFVTPDEAAILFTRPAAVPPSLLSGIPLDTGLSRVPAVYAGPLSEKTLLQQALSMITNRDSLARLEQEIIWTINSAIIAYGEKTRDLKQIQDITERVRDTISLGLEVLIAKEEMTDQPRNPAAARASELLEIWPIVDLFRHGFAATIALQEETRQALAKPQFETWYNLADTSQSDEPIDRLERAFLTALLARHPLRGGIDPALTDEAKAFACLAEIEEARNRLAKLVGRIS